MKHEKVMSTTFVNPLDYKGLPVSIEKWIDPPRMETGAPLPELTRVLDTLFVAYFRGDVEEPGFDVGLNYLPAFSLLRFDGVREHYIGPPNDEALHLHPLYTRGLTWYDFHKVIGSPKAIAPLQHWIMTFHDETVEVVAVSASVVYSSEINENATEIVQQLVAKIKHKE